MTRPGDPLRKVTLNLYDSDVVKLKAMGQGWSEQVREWVHEKLRGERERTYEPFLTEDFDAD